MSLFYCELPTKFSNQNKKPVVRFHERREKLSKPCIYQLKGIWTNNAEIISKTLGYCSESSIRVPSRITLNADYDTSRITFHANYTFRRGLSFMVYVPSKRSDVMHLIHTKFRLCLLKRWRFEDVAITPRYLLKNTPKQVCLTKTCRRQKLFCDPRENCGLLFWPRTRRSW